MPEHFKALVFVGAIAAAVFVIMRQSLVSAGGFDAKRYRHYAHAWILVTLVAFLSHNFWLFSFVVAILTYTLAKRDQNPLALYLVVLFAAPHFHQMLPGLGPIQNLFELSHVRTLNLSILLPFALAIYQKPQARIPLRLELPLLLFLALCAAKLATDGSVTMGVRSVSLLLVDVWLPYYVASRAIRTDAQFREIAVAASLGIALTAAIGIFETSKHWLVYESLRSVLGLPEGGMIYVARTEGGPLRAVTVTTWPVALGYMVMLGLGFFAIASRALRPRGSTLAIWLILLGGVIAPLSRGPWVGAFAIAVVMAVLGPGRTKRTAAGIATGAALLLIMSATPSGRLILDLLPFVGSAESSTVTYRERLWDTSMTVLWQNPIFGDLHFIDNPHLEQMRQSQGIIDITNTFLQVALPYGFVGLLLFVAALFFPTFATWRARAALAQSSADAEKLGRVLLAMMAGVIVTISTSSGIGAMPTMYWLLVGLMASYSQLAAAPLPSEAPVLGHMAAIPARQALGRRQDSQ
jgi:O-antigen ligase